MSKKNKLHIKPTNEQLDENIKKASDELDKLDEEENPKPTPQSVSETPEDSEEVETPEEEEEEPEEEPKKPDLEQRYRNSSAESHILYSKSKKMTEVIEKAGEIPEPTEDDMKKEYPEWEMMTDTEKKVAKESLHNKRKVDAMTEATKDFKDMDAWNKKIDDFLADPETLTNNPELEGKEEEFKVFALKDSRRGTDFEDLISSFLWVRGKEPGAKKKKQMFEVGSGGLNNPPKPPSDKISVEESRILRTTNYKKYLELLRAGKIEVEAI